MLSNDLTSKIINQGRQHQPNDISMVMKKKNQIAKVATPSKKIKKWFDKILLNHTKASTV